MCIRDEIDSICNGNIRVKKSTHYSGSLIHNSCLHSSDKNDNACRKTMKHKVTAVEPEQVEYAAAV